MCYFMHNKEILERKGGGNSMVNQVKLSQIVERFDLKNLTPDVDYTKTGVSVPYVNRPALQLT